MDSKNVVWILEDDLGAQFVYQETLKPHFCLHIFTTLREFKSALVSQSENYPQLLIADLRFPESDFLSFARSQGQLPFPFIVISSVDDIEILRACFLKGALDYLTKPFTKAELLVKVERILDAQQQQRSSVHLEPTLLKVKREEGFSAELTAKELKIFSVLYRTPGRVIRRQALEQEVWEGSRVGSKTLDVHLFNLRKKLARLEVEIRYTPPDGFLLLDKRDSENQG